MEAPVAVPGIVNLNERGTPNDRAQGRISKSQSFDLLDLRGDVGGNWSTEY